MPFKVKPFYPAGEVGSSTVAVRLSPLERSVLDYLAGLQGDTAGGLLRSIFRGVEDSAGQIVLAKNVKEVRSLVSSLSVLESASSSLVPSRLMICLKAGLYSFQKPLEAHPALDFYLLGAGPPSEEGRWPTVLDVQGGDLGVSLARVWRCAVRLDGRLICKI